MIVKRFHIRRPLAVSRPAGDHLGGSMSQDTGGAEFEGKLRAWRRWPSVVMIHGLFVWVMHHLVFRFTVQISAIVPPSAGDAPDARETSVILAWLLLVVCCCRVQGSDQLGEKRDPWERLPSRRGTNHTLTPLPGGSSIPQAPSTLPFFSSTSVRTSFLLCY